MHTCMFDCKCMYTMCQRLRKRIKVHFVPSCRTAVHMVNLTKPGFFDLCFGEESRPLNGTHSIFFCVNEY